MAAPKPITEAHDSKLKRIEEVTVELGEPEEIRAGLMCFDVAARAVFNLSRARLSSPRHHL